MLTGLLDPGSYFGGELKLDPDRARSAIEQNVAIPLGIDPEAAAHEMERAWVAKVADSVRAFTEVTSETTLAAFGGAGPIVVCRVAEALGISRVLIPGLAAFGLGFSDIEHQYEASLDDPDDLAGCLDKLSTRARRGMQAEGFALEECALGAVLQISGTGGDRTIALPAAIPARQPGEHHSIVLHASKAIAQPRLQGQFRAATASAVTSGARSVVIQGDRQTLPLFRVEDQTAGASAVGPAVLEEAFFTCRIDPGWSFAVNDGGDILLSRLGKQ